MVPALQPAGDPVLSVEHLRAYYQMKYFGIDREVRAVDDITLQIDPNEIYGLAGESSSGKTSFIKTIAAANRPPLNVVGGSVKFTFLDRDIHRLDREALAAVRWKHLSYIMQGSMNVLNPVRRIRRSFFDFAFAHIRRPEPEFLSIVETHLRRLHLEPSVLDAYPHELSGGMRQRVTIALATICRPEFIIADEPTTALDVVVQKGVLGMIREVQREMGSSILFVTHDMAVHANMADRLGIMYAGRLVEEAPTREIFAKPLHPYTAHLIESLPRIGDIRPKEALGGTPPNLSAPPPGCRFHPRCPLATDICRREVPELTTLAPGHRVACFAASPSVKPSAHAEPAEAAP
jgi:peptide/nickel transport system ATP-binding protein